MLKPGDHVFLKGQDVTDCHDFKTLLSGSQDCKPHFCNNLPQECAHVRKALERKEMTFCQSCTKPPWFMVEPSDSPISLASSSDNDNPNGDQPSYAHLPLHSIPPPGQNIKVELTNADHALHIKPTTAPMVIDLTASDNDSNTAPALMSSKCGHALSSPPSTPDSSDDGTH